MKKLEEVIVKREEIVEDPDEGFMALMGKPVILFGVNYNYAGKLVGVNSTCVLLENGGIVFETGEFSATKWKDFQVIGKKLYVQRSAIEAFIEGK